MAAEAIVAPVNSVVQPNWLFLSDAGSRKSEASLEEPFGHYRSTQVYLPDCGTVGHRIRTQCWRGRTASSSSRLDGLNLAHPGGCTIFHLRHDRIKLLRALVGAQQAAPPAAWRSRSNRGTEPTLRLLPVGIEQGCDGPCTGQAIPGDCDIAQSWCADRARWR